MRKIWEIVPGLVRTVKAAHQAVGLDHGGHDFDHALRVGQMAYRVAFAENEFTAELAGMSGLSHNNDRILERRLQLKSESVSCVPEEAVIELTEKMLSPLGLTHKQRKLIITAVLNHGTKPNSPDDHLVSIALADADRLINMEPDVIIRNAQYHADIPALDPVYIEATPGAKYRDPKTVAWDIANCITWAAEEGPYVIRLSLARELAKERAAYLCKFFETIKHHRAELGLMPYPEF